MSVQSGCRGLTQTAAAVVVGLQRDDLADRAVVDPLHRLAEAVVVAQAQAGDDRQVLLLRPASQVASTRADAGRIDGHRLLGEDVLAGLDRGLEVQRPEVRRRAEQHHVAPQSITCL